MQKPSVRNLNDILLLVGVFVFLLIYTQGILFRAPYPGFYFNPIDGEVWEIYQTDTSALQVGDFIERVGPITLGEFRADKNLNIFKGLEQGETVEIAIRRNGSPLTIAWAYPGFTWGEFVTHIFNIWWLAYVFWAIGAFTQLSMRPRDVRWRLFVAINYLMAMFIMLGSVSTFQIMWSATLLRAVAWLLLPTYLHFHWVFPKPLKPLPRWLGVLFYTVCTAFAAGELFQLLPRTLYALAVALALLGSILLLFWHFAAQREHRREVGFLAAAVFLSTFFTILISISGGRGHNSQNGPLSLLALPILPLAYFYILYRHRLGGLELRANRTISLYLFIVLLGMVLLLILGDSGLIDIRREMIVFATVMIAAMTAILGILMFPGFQAFIERRILGVRLPGQGLGEAYSARIVTSSKLADLTRLLRDDVFPSLLVRQYAVIRNLNPSAEVMLSREVSGAEIEEGRLKEWFSSYSPDGSFPPLGSVPMFDWVHLVLPLQVGSELIGVWLLGRRDPDDHYPQAELPMLRSLANQMAIALSNLIQSERIKSMYDANIDRYEQERLKLARDLHDNVLNGMAGILMNQDELSRLPGFDEAYKRLIDRLREIISELRPPSLEYGLKFALEGLADNLSERQHDTVRIVTELQADGVRKYPEVVENNLYRIVQEACENALKYSQAGSIHVAGELLAESIALQVRDSGIGSNVEIDLRRDDLVANKHFGLAGMRERAELIGAEIEIDSKPGQGMQVRVRWEAK